MTNPFLHGNPIPPAYFFGRKKELRRIANRISGQGQSTAVIGEPRSGKSSLLLYLSTPENRETLFGTDAKILLFSFVDIQGVGHKFTQTDFWKRALSPLNEQLVSRYPESAIATAYHTCEDSAFGMAVLERLVAEMQRAALRLVLLLDEFDVFLSHPVLNSAEFFAGLRSLISRSGGAIAMVATSRHSLSQLNTLTQQFNWTGSPFFNFLSELVLGPLAEKAVNNLLGQAGKRLSTEDRQFVTRIAGGHPYLLQAAASTLWEVYEDGGEYNPQQRRELAGQYLHDTVSSTLDATWKCWSAETRMAVSTVALDQAPRLLPLRSFHQQRLLKDLGDFGPEVRALTRQGFLTEDETNPGGWRLRPEVMLWWLTEELTRITRDERELGQWIRAQEWDGLLTKGEKERFVGIGREIGEVVKGVVPDLIKGAAKKLVG